MRTPPTLMRTCLFLFPVAFIAGCGYSSNRQDTAFSIQSTVASVAVGGTVTLQAKLTTGEAVKDVTNQTTWTVSDNSIATVQSGILRSKSVGTVTVSGTLNAAAPANAPLTASTSLTITPMAPVITWPQPPGVPAGTALTSTQLDATANVPGTFAYNPAAGTPLQAGTQTLTATFTPSDSKTYSSATASTTINVTNSGPNSPNLVAPVITWPQPAGVTAGTPLGPAQLDATANVPGTFAYNPAAGTVLKAGAQTLTANFTPADPNTYSSITASATINVTTVTSQNPALIAPIITWQQPGGVTAGTALSAVQLDAAANVPGSFTYNPTAGTVLQAGTQTLTADFIPSDSRTYSSATVSTTINVTTVTSQAPTLIAPIITWPQPASVIAGTALSSAQLNATANVPGTFTYSPGAGTVLQAGIQTLTATFTPSDSKDYLPASAFEIVIVGSITPVITWPQPAAAAAGTLLSPLQLDATANVPGTFTYNPAAGTVLQAGMQTLTASFTPSDSKDYSSTTASTTISVALTTPVITWPQPAAVTAGVALSAAQLAATANVPGTFAYNPVAGTVLHAGTQTLTATFSPSDPKDYSSATASTSITVTSTTPIINWPQPANIAAGTALSGAQLNATSNVPGTFTYNPAAGTVLQVGTQTLMATFTPSDSKDYSTAIASATVIVSSATPVITWPQPANVTAGTALGGAQLDATANVPGIFTYNPAAGAVLQVGTQTLTATFTPSDSKNYSSATASTTIIVSPTAPMITWPQPAAVTAGTVLSSAQLDATANVPGTFTYNPAAGTILHAGTQTLTATFTPSDSKDYSSATASATVVVSTTTPIITWPQPTNITAGTPLSAAQLDATANVPGTFTYSPPAGTLLKTGTQTLTANFVPSNSKDYSSVTASTTINVTDALITPVITWPQPANIATGTTLSAAQLDATANVPGTFIYNPAVGTVLVAGTQTLTATFIPTDSKDYSSATASATIIVTSTTPVITWPQPSSVAAGTALSAAQLDATANVPGTFTYNPAGGAVLHAGTQTLTATFTPSDSKDYSSATASATIIVTSTTPVITWPQPTSVTAGTALSQAQLDAAANVAGTFTYLPAAGTVLNVGTQTLTASFMPSDSKDYSSATVSATIVVTSATPVITWPQPATVTAGTLLSPMQLDATANVPGTFTYSPAAGTMLKAGTQALTASFTPSDAKDYSTATASTTITVTSPTPVIIWSQPASIAAGTALSSTQLNATANVPGTFTYNPAAGAILQTGTQTLTASFTPVDSKDYSSATASTIITVAAPSATLTAIQISGSSTVGAGASIQMQATGTYSDKTTKDITSSGTWISSQYSVATVQAGLVSGVNAGTVSVTVTLNGVNASTTISVTNGYVIQIDPSMSQSEIQSAISGSQAGDTVAFAPGTYNLVSNSSNAQSAALSLVAGVKYLGPASGSPAILSATGGYFLMVTYPGSTGVTVQHLTFNVGGLFLGGGVSNVNVENNVFQNIDANYGNWTTTTAIFIETSAANSDFSYNTFQNLGLSVQASYVDTNNSSGIQFYGLSNVTIEHNIFSTFYEGISGDFDYLGGDNVHINYNTFTRGHRMAIEVQHYATTSLEVAYNNVSNASNPWALTFGLSIALGGTGTTVHDNTLNANVLPNSGCPGYPGAGCYNPYGIEAAGNGTQVYSNTVEGYWGWGVAIGGASNLSVTNNYICGPTMYADDPSSGSIPGQGNANGFVLYESSTQPGTVVSGNIVSASMTCGSGN